MHSYRWRAARKRSRRLRAAGLMVLALAVGAGVIFWTPDSQPVASPAGTVAAGPRLAAAPRSTERTAALAPLNLPNDDAVHGAGMEWWYYSGILDAQGGGRYAFHVAVFVANGLVKHTVMHTAVTDLQTGKRYLDQVRTGGSPARAEAGKGFDFRQDGWQVSGAGPTHALKVSAGGATLALDLVDAREPVAHRADGSTTPGLLDFGSSGISYYYSRPRMPAHGTISIGGRPVDVRGDVWFDHQWGEFDVTTLGWNWFALHLADGSDVMLYELFNVEGRKVMTAGTVATRDGATPLKPGDVELVPVSRWSSPRTKIDYAVGWRIRLPSGEFAVAPILADSEFDSSSTSGNVYWEGPIKVTGSIAGEGFMELSGYDRLSTTSSIRR